MDLVINFNITILPLSLRALTSSSAILLSCFTVTPNLDVLKIKRKSGNSHERLPAKYY